MKQHWTWYATYAASRLCTSLVFDLKSYGVENIPRTGGCLIVSNHQSVLDPVILAVHLRRPMSYLAKSELFAHPLFGWYIRKLHAFPVKQGAGDVGAIKETIRRLQEGHLLSIFPEGSRSTDGELQPIEPGVTTVIRRVNVPVVPAVVYGTLQAWPRGKKLFGFHPVQVMYGPPLAIHGLPRQAQVDLIGDTLRRMLAEIKLKRARRRAGDPI